MSVISSKEIATKAGSMCLKMELHLDRNSVYVVNGVCYFENHRASSAQRFGGNPRPPKFKVSRDGKDKFKTEEA